MSEKRKASSQLSGAPAPKDTSFQVDRAIDVGFWLSGNQRLGVGVARIVEKGFRRGLFDDQPTAHHGHLVRDAGHNGQIVRDEEIGQVQTVLQIFQADVRICSCTDTSSAEVGSSQTIKLRVQHHGAGNGQALPLTAGKRMRVTFQHIGVQPDALQHLGRLVPLFGNVDPMLWISSGSVMAS